MVKIFQPEISAPLYIQ